MILYADDRILHQPHFCQNETRLYDGSVNMKYTLLLTQRCNLACPYCYIGKRNSRMSIEVADRIIEFAYRNTPPGEKIDVGFFGGEPLLEFELLKEITYRFKHHRHFDENRVLFTLVTNGTIFSSDIADFVERHKIGFGISCDGPPAVHDLSRRFANGQPSSAIVERTIRQAIAAFSGVMVNAVYCPQTLMHLPETVEYLSSLGVRQIYLNPDFTAQWTEAEIQLLPEVYRNIGEHYIDYYRQRDPHFISLIDSKIAVILRQGYHSLEHCRMGCGEFAFSPEGNIYPCERLVGDGTNGHCIGDIYAGIQLERLQCRRLSGDSLNQECLDCGLKDYCMNWCGCSNYFSSGYYNRVSPFLCASERAAIQTAFNVFQVLEKDCGGCFFDHLGGVPLVNSLLHAVR